MSKQERKRNKALAWFFALVILLIASSVFFRERIFEFFKIGYVEKDETCFDLKDEEGNEISQIANKAKTENDNSKEEADNSVSLNVDENSTDKPSLNVKSQTLSNASEKSTQSSSTPSMVLNKNSEKNEVKKTNTNEKLVKNPKKVNKNQPTSNEKPSEPTQPPKENPPIVTPPNSSVDNSSQTDTKPAESPTATQPLTPPAPAKKKISDELVERVYNSIKDTKAIDSILAKSDFSKIRVNSSEKTKLFIEKSKALRAQLGVETLNADQINQLMKEAEDEIRATQPRSALESEYLRATEAQKANLKEQIRKSLENSARYLELDDPKIEEIARKIETSKEDFLAGALYLDKFFNFEIAGKNLADRLKNSPQEFKAGQNSVDWLISLGKNLNFEKAKTSNNLTTFASEISKLVGEKDAVKFIENELTKNGISNANEWFKDASSATILEGKSPINGATVSLFDRLKADPSHKAKILPILNANDSLYVISSFSSITFGMKEAYGADFAELLAKTTENQNQFNRFWYNLTSDTQKSNLARNTLTTDTLLPFGKYGAENWTPKYSSQIAAVNEIISPFNLYTNYFGANAQEGNGNIVFWIARVLSEAGQGTMAHEMIHNLDTNVVLHGNQRRSGTDAEFYATGLLEPPRSVSENYFSINTSLDFSNNPARMYNSKPENLDSEEKLQNYVANTFEALYTLDLAEANAILAKNSDAKKLWFKKVEAKKEADGSVSDHFRKFTDEEWQNLRWQNVSDLIENGAVAERYFVKGVQKIGDATKAAQYFTVPMFVPIFGNANNTSGISGPITFRRNAFEILALKGYKNGMLPYISNKFAAEAQNENKPLSDDYILGKIYGKNTTMAELRKEHFAKISAKTGNLKSLKITLDGQKITVESFAKLEQLMSEAVEKDLAYLAKNPNGYPITAKSNVDKLKEAYYQAALIQSSDFTDSIYN